MDKVMIEEIASEVSKGWGMSFGGVELDFAIEVAKRAIYDERSACAKICDDERDEFMEKACENNGRDSDFAFGSMNSAERIKAAILERYNVKLTGEPLAASPAEPKA